MLQQTAKWKFAVNNDFHSVHNCSSKSFTYLIHISLTRLSSPCSEVLLTAKGSDPIFIIQAYNRSNCEVR